MPRDGGDEGTTVEVGLLELLPLGVEDGQDLLAGMVEAFDRLGEPARRAVVSRGHVSGHQLLLAAAKEVVQRSLCHPGTLDDPVVVLGWPFAAIDPGQYPSTGSPLHAAATSTAAWMVS